MFGKTAGCGDSSAMRLEERGKHRVKLRASRVPEGEAAGLYGALVFVSIAAIPMTVNGKVDYKNLPQPDLNTLVSEME